MNNKEYLVRNSSPEAAAAYKAVLEHLHIPQSKLAKEADINLSSSCLCSHGWKPAGIAISIYYAMIRLGAPLRMATQWLLLTDNVPPDFPFREMKEVNSFFHLLEPTLQAAIVGLPKHKRGSAARMIREFLKANEHGV
jgi:hypothetical protein